METKQQNKLKLGAKISLVVVLLTIVEQLATFYHTENQLISPLIPESTILIIVRPFIFMAFISTLVSIVGLILHFYQKNLLVIILSGLT